MGKSWGGEGKPPVWTEKKIYYSVLTCLVVFLVIVGFKEGWL